MISLTVLRLSFTFWKRTLDLSKRLSGLTWLALALLNASIAISAFSLYRAEEVSELAIPPVYYVDRNLMPAHQRNDVPRIAHFAWNVIEGDASTDLDLYIWDTEGLNGPESLYEHLTLLKNARYFRPILSASTYKPLMAVLLFSGHGYTTRYTHFENSFQFGGVPYMMGFQVNDHTHIQTTDRRWEFPNFLDQRDQVVLQLSTSDTPDLLTRTQQIVAILVSLVTTLFSALSAFFAWQVYRRAKAQEILMQLQIAKLRAEFAEQEAKTRKEQAETGIILVS